MIFDSLPDDILNLIYSKIKYSQLNELQSEIIKYGEIREWLYYIRSINNINILEEILIDLIVVYLAITIDNIVPTSVDINQLSKSTLCIFDEYLLIIDYYNDLHDKGDEISKQKIYEIIKVSIKNMMLSIDSYYLQNILEPLIFEYKYKEINTIGFVTYNGLTFDDINN